MEHSAVSGPWVKISALFRTLTDSPRIVTIFTVKNSRVETSYHNVGWPLLGAHTRLKALKRRIMVNLNSSMGLKANRERGETGWSRVFLCVKSDD